MKKINTKRLQRLILLYCMLVFTSLSGQHCIKKAAKLTAHKQYRSAWLVLDKADPNNSNPSIALAKSDLLLNYYINTVMHQVFTLKDLEADQKPENFRGKNENGTLIRFDPEAVLDSLLKKYPSDYRLNEGLGNYYYQVFLLFQEKWLKKPEDLVKAIEDNYMLSCAHGLKTYTAEYRIGFARLFTQRFKDSKASFLESLALNPSYPDAWYSLSYSCLQLGLADSAMQSANKAYELFKDTFNKSDVNLLRGMIYSSRKDTLAALGEYKAALKLNPSSPNIYALLLKAELRYNDKELPKVASDYFDLNPTSPETYSELINGYFEFNKTKEILEFFSTKLSKYKSNPEVSGDLLFYRAYIYVIMEEKEMARKDLLEARDDFKKIFPPDHEMFGTIEEALKELNK
ncbi:MAG: tetratricopeptide repeat protein [Bacteroidia bacterium]